MVYFVTENHCNREPLKLSWSCINLSNSCINLNVLFEFQKQVVTVRMNLDWIETEIGIGHRMNKWIENCLHTQWICTEEQSLRVTTAWVSASKEKRESYLLFIVASVLSSFVTERFGGTLIDDDDDFRWGYDVERRWWCPMTLNRDGGCDCRWRLRFSVIDCVLGARWFCCFCAWILLFRAWVLAYARCISFGLCRITDPKTNVVKKKKQ
jgi:hypothetical protein